MQSPVLMSILDGNFMFIKIKRANYARSSNPRTSHNLRVSSQNSNNVKATGATRLGRRVRSRKWQTLYNH